MFKDQEPDTLPENLKHTWLCDAVQRAHERREVGQHALRAQPRRHGRDEPQRGAALQLPRVALVVLLGRVGSRGESRGGGVDRRG